MGGQVIKGQILAVNMLLGSFMLTFTLLEDLVNGN